MSAPTVRIRADGPLSERCPQQFRDAVLSGTSAYQPRGTQTGIGRQIGEHLHRLVGVGAGPGDPAERLATVLRTYANLSTAHATNDLSGMPPRGDHVTRARQHLLDFVAGLVAEAATVGAVRDDVPAAELAAFCLQAMTAAADLSPTDRTAGIDRLVAVTVAGMGSVRASRRR